MSVLTPPNSTTYENPEERLAIATLIADVTRPYRDCWVGATWFGCSDTRNLLPKPESLEWDHRPAVLESLARDLALISTRSASTLGCIIAATSHVLTTASQARPVFRPAWRPQITAANTHEEIIAVFRLFGLDAIADRLGYLHCLTDDDPDESPIELESLRAMAIFLMSERHLPDPQIGINPNGLMQIQWRVLSSGLLAIEFLSTEMVRFAGISEPARPGVERVSVNGTLPKDAALEAVQPFTSQL